MKPSSPVDALPSISALLVQFWQRPSDDFGPDDPALVWGDASAAIHTARSYRLCPHFDAEQISVQLDPSSDNGSRRVAYLAELCQPIAPLLARPSLRVLQAGCGVGNWIGFLASRVDNLRFVGLDRSEAALEIARSRFGGLPGIRLIRADLREPPELGAFDLVLLDYEILNHFSLSNARNILAWAWRSLAPGGHVFGDVRLDVPGPAFARSFRFRRTNTGLWYRRGRLRPGVEGRAVALWDLQSGVVTTLIQDVLRSWTPADCAALFGGYDAQLEALDEIATDKAECRSGTSFLLRRP